MMTADSVSQRGSNVRRLYRLGSARWYDPFRVLWVRLTARAAEAELDRLLRESVVDGGRVLDVGCGTGHNLGRLQRIGSAFASYRGIDFTEAMLDIARRRYQRETRAIFEQRDLHELTKDAERYALILCTWVASHLERSPEVFEMTYQLLAPDGHALFLTLTRPHWYVAWWFTPLVHLKKERDPPWMQTSDSRS